MIIWRLINFLMPMGLEGCHLENAVEEMVYGGVIETNEYRLVDRYGNIIAEWPYNPSLTDIMEFAKGVKA